MRVDRMGNEIKAERSFKLRFDINILSNDDERSCESEDENSKWGKDKNSMKNNESSFE